MARPVDCAWPGLKALVWRLEIATHLQVLEGPSKRVYGAIEHKFKSDDSFLGVRSVYKARWSQFGPPPGPVFRQWNAAGEHGSINQARIAVFEALKKAYGEEPIQRWEDLPVFDFSTGDMKESKCQ